MENDRSDEMPGALASCRAGTEFACGDPRHPERCLLRSQLNDGIRDCADGTDELPWLKMACHHATEFRCLSGPARCVLRRRVNDGHPDCGDGSDEGVTDHRCFADLEFSCGGGEMNRCIPRSWVGNRVEDCADGSDEKIDHFACTPEERPCADGSRCLPAHLTCDGVQNCVDGSDETEFSCGDAPTMARCRPDGAELLPWSKLLHQTFNTITGASVWSYCLEGWDLKGQSELRKGFKCVTRYLSGKNGNHEGLIEWATERRRLVPQVYLKNNMSVCYNRDDVCRDAAGAFNCSRCLDSTVISPAQLCDGVVDCVDASDECSCQKSSAAPLCDVVYGEGAGIELKRICDNVPDLDEAVDEEFCDSEVMSFTDKPKEKERQRRAFCKVTDGNGTVTTVGQESFCDGAVDCPSKIDECTSECFVDLVNSTRITDPDQYGIADTSELARFFRNCFPIARFDGWSLAYPIVRDGERVRVVSGGFGESTCHVFFSSPNDQLLNSLLRVLCDDEIARFGRHRDMDFLCELDGVECPWMHLCASDRNQKIDKNRVCDFVEDCLDGSDEADCASTHFYCTNQDPPFVPIAKKQDGASDCSDRSDECFETEFSSATQMIKSTPLRVYIWISASLILVSNVAVLHKLAGVMRGVGSRRTAAYFNTFALINLSVSDSIFAFVLLVIGAKSEQFSGRYCASDLEWRTSAWCGTVGTLTLVSSQTSINLLVLMTAVRVYVTYKPFMAKRLSVKVIYVCSALAWLVSLIIALLPIPLHETFIHSVYVEPNPFLADQYLSVSDLDSYINRSSVILSRSQRDAPPARGIADLGSWYFGTEQGRSEFPRRHVTVRGSFGYYSSSPVCFPNFYAHGSTTADYSIAIVCYNLTCLLLISAGYALIFRMADRSRASLGVADTQSSKTMKHIAYIIFTNIICWLPIIIMSFMSYNGFKLPEIAHTLSTIVFLPINSFLNPVIYSRIDQPIRHKIVAAFASAFSKSQKANQNRPRA
ncbi:MAG: 7 transmembrane receptor [Planctomycetota bacterium]